MDTFVKEDRSHRVDAQSRSKPFFEMTSKMLECVSLYDFDTLSGICDDDFGIVDINTKGGSEIIRNRKGWEEWFRNLFQQLDQMKATTWSEITRYEAVQMVEMGYSVVDFDQLLIVDNQTMRFCVIATIIWKQTPEGWKEARYHSSLISVKEE